MSRHNDGAQRTSSPTYRPGRNPGDARVRPAEITFTLHSAIMTHRVFVLAAAATIASAAPRIIAAQAVPDKPAPPAAAATTDTTKDVDPVGTYTTYITAQGNSLTTTTRIDKNADGTYGGTVTAEGIPPLPVNSVTVAGNKIRVSITAPDGSEAVISMVLTGDDITGSWSMSGDGSSLTGKKSP
jgi:hypothetical protein